MFRTRSIPEIFGASFRLLREHFGPILIISLVFTGIPSVAQEMLERWQGEEPSTLFVFGSLLFVLLVPSFLGSIAVAYLLFETALGRTVSVAQALVYPLRTTAGVIAALLVGVMVLGGLLAFVLPGLYLLVAYSLLASVVAVEDPPVPVAFARSWNLLQDRRLAALAITLAVVTPTVFSIAADAYFGERSEISTALETVLSVLLAMIADIAIFLLYIDCRLRKEDWDPMGEALSAVSTPVDHGV